MPTPIGHALGGLAVGAIIVRNPAVGLRLAGRRLPILVLFAVLGALADVDFVVFAPHRSATHSLVAACLVGTLAMLVVPRQPVIWVASAAAYVSHLLLDWLGADTATPFGIMALWPFDTTHYQAPWLLFPAVCRQYWVFDCWVSLAGAVGYEVLELGPFALAAVRLSRRRG